MSESLALFRLDDITKRTRDIWDVGTLLSVHMLTCKHSEVWILKTHVCMLAYEVDLLLLKLVNYLSQSILYLFQFCGQLYPRPLFNQWTNFNKTLKIILYNCKKKCVRIMVWCCLYTHNDCRASVPLCNWYFNQCLHSNMAVNVLLWEIPNINLIKK